jgi:CRP/FNR family cyclic AMP-dependent transcriptional regulator
MGIGQFFPNCKARAGTPPTVLTPQLPFAIDDPPIAPFNHRMADLSTSTLPAVGWISQLKEDDRAILSSYGEFIPAHPDKPVIKEGDSQTNLYFVISGSLKVKHSGQKGEHVIASIKAGESFGEISVFDPGPASATVIAFEFSQLWRINQDELLSFIRDNPAVGNQILIALTTLLSQRLRRLDPVLVNFIDRHIETSA